MKRQVLGLIVFLLLCFMAAGIGSLFTMPAIASWYATLPKPAWTPPAWVFGPVWSALYTLMAVAAWLVWNQRGVLRALLPLALFASQLVLNVLWSYLFFGLHRVGAAAVDIVFLWVAILLTLLAFGRVRPLAGWLLLPYLLWVTYAATLNFGIVVLLRV